MSVVSSRHKARYLAGVLRRIERALAASAGSGEIAGQVIAWPVYAGRRGEPPERGVREIAWAPREGFLVCEVNGSDAFVAHASFDLFVPRQSLIAFRRAEPDHFVVRLEVTGRRPVRPFEFLLFADPAPAFQGGLLEAGAAYTGKLTGHALATPRGRNSYTCELTLSGPLHQARQDSKSLTGEPGARES